MREATRQRILADTGVVDLAPPTLIVRGPERRTNASTRTPDRRKKQRRKEANVTAENRPIVAPVLMLEAAGENAQILAEGTSENHGVMRLKVPFYVSNSVASIAGFSKKLYFPGSILAETVASGNRTIASKSPGLTAYARHSHATAKNDLPCGDVISLEQSGDKGYATIDVNQTRWGQDIQALARAGQLRAVSLRTGTGYQVAERKVNGELMLEAQRLDLEGIDFAPDGAAMPTYGVEVLAAEAAVEPAPTSPPRRKNPMDDITIDGLRAEHSQIVTEIEAPLKKRIAELEAKDQAHIEAERVSKRDAMVAEIAAKFPQPAEAQAELQKLCAEAKTDNEVAALAMPLLLEALSTSKPEPKVDPAQKLRDMFATSGRGVTIQAESTHDSAPSIDGFAVPAN